jgi:hypothetical protein
MRTANLIQQITKAEDLDTLQGITRKILGELCWDAGLSYGDELSVEIGQKIPYTQKSMAGVAHGAWSLGTRGSEWTLELQGEVIASSQLEPEEIKQKVKVIEGTKISIFETTYPDLILIVGFSNGCQLKVFPDFEDLDLSCWELFTPDLMLLEMGPGRVWSYIPADVPMNAITSR